MFYTRYKRTGLEIIVMRKTACEMVNSVTVCNVPTIFNCTPMVRALDVMTAPALKLSTKLVIGVGWCLVFGLAIY